MRLSVFSELLFPPRCIACNRLIEPGVQSKTAAFCPACKREWEEEMAAQCPECHMALCRCTCIPDAMKKQGVVSFIKLASYRSEEPESVPCRVIHRIKHQSSKRAFSFLGTELADGVRDAVALLERERGEAEKPSLPTVVAYIPRARETKRREGFDQARELARSLAAATELPFRDGLLRKRDGVPQKELTAVERRENLRDAFKCASSLSGYRVLLVDDVVTTGAGMSIAAALLRKAGAEEIVAVSVAHTVKKARNKKQ